MFGAFLACGGNSGWWFYFLFNLTISLIIFSLRQNFRNHFSVIVRDFGRVRLDIAIQYRFWIVVTIVLETNFFITCCEKQRRGRPLFIFSKINPALNKTVYNERASSRYVSFPWLMSSENKFIHGIHENMNAATHWKHKQTEMWIDQYMNMLHGEPQDHTNSSSIK